MRALRATLVVLFAGLCSPGLSLQAQGQAGTTNEGAGTLTLHAYQNLIQLPVLVLNAHREALPPIAAERFSVSQDAGPPFRVTHVRLEGDDPIALAILLDGQSLRDAGTLAAAKAVATLADGSLRAADTVSVYTLGCSLKGTAHPQPGTVAGVANALAAGFPGGRLENEKGCRHHIGLWDSLLYVEGALERQAGRRVVLVISDGEEQRSRYTEREVWRAAGVTATTIFGIRETGRSDPDEELGLLCEGSGGLILASRLDHDREAMERVLGMVRGRYVLEFPRANNATAGVHSISVRIAKGGNLFVRSSGISVPTPDARVLSDPTTIPNDATRAPTMGSRREVDSR